MECGRWVTMVTHSQCVYSNRYVQQLITQMHVDNDIQIEYEMRIKAAATNHHGNAVLCRQEYPK